MSLSLAEQQADEYVPLRVQTPRLFRRLRGSATVSAAARLLPPGKQQRSVDCQCGHIRQRHPILPEHGGTRQQPAGACEVEGCACIGYVRTDAMRSAREHASRQYVLAIEREEGGANLTLEQMDHVGERYGVGFRLVPFDLETGKEVEVSPVLHSRR